MTVSAEPHDVDSDMLFIRRDSRINRRYITPGLEVNTGKYERQKVHIRDARPRRGECSLDSTGFELIDHKSAVLLQNSWIEIDIGNGFHGSRTD